MQNGPVEFSRRSFLARASASAGAFLLSDLALSNQAFGSKKKRITILHTNDTHSHIDPFPEDHKKYAGLGGVSARAREIARIRQEKENVLLLDAGDIFQGTPYFNRFGGVLEMKVMEALKYDAATMGNHDFDGGLDGFVKASSHASFPFVCSNYDFSNTPMDGLSSKTKIFEKGGIRVGIFGLGIELDGLVPKKLYKETKVNNALEIANDCVRELQSKECDLIVCLSHLGFDYQDNRLSDKILAQKTSGIHLILGGHTHTFLDTPFQSQNALGLPVLVNQVGWAGLQLGCIEFEVDKEIRLKNLDKTFLDLK